MLQEVFEDIKEVFQLAIDATGMDNYITLWMVANNRQKDLFKVSKVADDIAFIHNEEHVIKISVNQKVFEQLPDELKNMAAEEALCGVFFDTEKDKLTVKKPDVSTFSGFLRKYGHEQYEILRESITTLYQAKGEIEAETGS